MHILCVTEAPAPLNDVSQGAHLFFGENNEVKKTATFEEQVELLKGKNIIIDEPNECLTFLSKVNYYRFSAYYLPFRGKDGKCVDDVPFTKIKQIYEFDKELRILILSIIEDIEIHIRTQMAYYHSHKYGSEGYMLSGVYNNSHDHASFTNHIASCIKDNRKSLVVQHHIENYDGKFPLWVIIEFFSIGMLPYFYRGMKLVDKKAIAINLYNTSYKNLSSWLRCITDLRNKCAHYSRLYYSIFPAIPRIPREVHGYVSSRRLFDQLYMLKFMYPTPERWEERFTRPLEKLVKKYKPYIDTKHLGVPLSMEI